MTVQGKDGVRTVVVQRGTVTAVDGSVGQRQVLPTASP